jgi:hypothetical protein
VRVLFENPDDGELMALAQRHFLENVGGRRDEGSAVWGATAFMT